MNINKLIINKKKIIKKTWKMNNNRTINSSNYLIDDYYIIILIWKKWEKSGWNVIFWSLNGIYLFYPLMAE